MNQMLQNVSGILMIAADSFLITGAVSHLMEIKRKWWAWLIVCAACWIIAGMIIFIGDWVNLPPTLMVFLAASWIGCKGSRWKKLIIPLILASSIFSCNALIDNFFMRHVDSIMPFRLLFAAMLFLGTKRFMPERDYELEPKMWRLLLLLTLVPIGIVLSVILLSDEYWVFSYTDLKLQFALLCISLLSFAGLLWTVTVLVRQQKLEQQNMFAQINQKYYETMEQQHFEIRRLKHDLANHLQVLSLLPEKEKDAYILEMLENTAVTKSLNYCGDSAVNAVLTVKENVIRQKKIRWDVMLDIPEELPFEKADVCAIFANALDNAIEACDKLEEKKREIVLESRARKGMMVLKVKNPCCEGAAETKKEMSGKSRSNVLPPTSKSDKKNHGLGLKSIKEIVNRNGGELEITREPGSFELFLYIPLHH